MTHALFILGMHRSGTSALARVVNLLGVDLGSQLMPAADDNEKGFWEHEGVVAIHEELLRALGHGWQDGMPLPDGWQESDAARAASTALSTLIDAEFAGKTLWGVKDPRQSILFPLWESLLKARNITAKIILAYRHPLEVAASLQKRDELDQESALYCWLGYTLEALRAAQAHDHAVLRYDALMENWRDTVIQLGVALKLTWPVPVEEAADAIETFLEPGLRHHKTPGPLPHTPIGDMTARAMALLGHFDTAEFETLCKEWHGYGAALHPLLRASRLAQQQWQRKALDETHRAGDVSSQLEQLKGRYNASENQRRDAEHELALIKSSTSWKLTQPLRNLKATIKKPA